MHRHMLFLPQNGRGPEDLELFLSPSENTGKASCYFESGDRIRFFGTGIVPHNTGYFMETHRDFKGTADVYGLLIWGQPPGGRPLVRGGKLNVHPLRPGGVTSAQAAPGSSRGLVKRPNFLKKNPADEVVSAKGRKCWRVSPYAKSPGLHVIDVWVDYYEFRFGKAPAVEFSMDYLDAGRGTVEIFYDAREEPRKKMGEITLAGTGGWKTYTCTVRDAMFAHRMVKLYRNDDIQIVAKTSAPLHVSRISIVEKR
jgi:hypothetical protein